MEQTKSKLRKQPQIIYKNEQGFRHDLFKLEIAQVKKNRSFKKGHVKIEEIEHTHVFHTYDSAGRAKKYCEPVAGHFHEIKWYTNDDGKLVAECGPALQEKYVKRGGMQQKKIAPIVWEDEINDQVVEDNHTHTCVYRWSEELSKDMVNQRRNALKTQLSTQMQIVSAQQVAGIEEV